MALNSITSQMSETVEYVVTKRQVNFGYIKRAHQGQVHWLNMVKLSKANIYQSFGPDKLEKRVRRWFMLGLAAGKLLELPNGSLLVRGVAQLLEEYEHYLAQFTGLANQFKGTRPLAANTSASSGPTAINMSAAYPSQQAHEQLGTSDPVKPTIHKLGKQVIYAHLHTPSSSTCANLDYCEVVYSMCDVMALVYSKFLDTSCDSPMMHHAILKIDRKIKTLVVSKICDDLTAVTTPLLKFEIKGLLSHMFYDEDKSNAVSKKFINLIDKQGEGLVGVQELASMEEERQADDFD